MQIRRFCKEDAGEVSCLIGRNFIEINSRDYPLSEMQELAKQYDEGKIIELASGAHMYVLLDGDVIIATGSIGSLMGSKTQSILLAIYVLPEYHSRGIGAAVMRTLEQDELFLRAKRIEVHASLTAHSFYKKFGFSYKDGLMEPDDNGLLRMERIC